MEQGAGAGKEMDKYFLARPVFLFIYLILGPVQYFPYLLFEIIKIKGGFFFYTFS